MGISDRIRDHVRLKYVEPARLSHQQRFSVRCGTVQKELGISNRIAQVCTALKTPKFLDPNGLRLVETSGPPSGTSTTVVYTFEFRDSTGNTAASANTPASQAAASIYAKLRQVDGILKDVYAELGGSERAIREEREGYSR